MDPAPAQLRVTDLDADTDANLLHQYAEPGDWLFAIDTDHLFADGLPPFVDSLEASPAFVEMAAPGLLGGRCPPQGATGAMATTTTHTVAVRRVDRRSDHMLATVNVTCLAGPRDRTATHSPADGAELGFALKASGRRVIQLRPNVAYDGFGNLYGAFAESAAEPVLVLGAPGDGGRDPFDNVGHIEFEGVAFVLGSEDTLVYARRRGVRLRNATLLGFRGSVDLPTATTGCATSRTATLVWVYVYERIPSRCCRSVTWRNSIGI